MQNEMKLELVHDSNVQHEHPEIDYLPWGTRTLKLLLKGSNPGVIFVRPTPLGVEDEYIAARVSSADAEGHLEISWGGGHERGFKIKGIKEKAHIYFNVRHFGPDTTQSYRVTFVVLTEDEVELDQIEIELNPPAAHPGIDLIPQWSILENGQLKKMVLQPSSTDEPLAIPSYQSRWWPSSYISYIEKDYLISSPPIFSLTCKRNSQTTYSINVIGQLDEEAQPVDLVKIDGDIAFPLIDLKHLSLDLFFANSHWWLRIWFWWLDKGVAPKLNGPFNSEEQELLQRWATKQEIPDAERIDLVLNKDLKPVFLATDLHWHEMWASFDGDLPIQASIAGVSKSEVVFRGMKGLKMVTAGKAYYHLNPPAYDPLFNVKEKLDDPHRVPADVGSILHKHTPYFHGIEFEEDLVSSDVRKG